MKILGLELSSPEGSIAWCESGEELLSVRFPNDRKHSGAFFENLQAGLKRFGNPERIVVGLGPGSYAGTRIAIATATGLAAASGAQLTGMISLSAMETEANEYVVIGDARRQSFYFAQVRDRLCLEGPKLCTEAELRERLCEIACPVFATESLAAFAGAKVAYPSAFVLAQLGRPGERPSLGGAQPNEPLEPIYLREPLITYPKPAR